MTLKKLWWICEEEDENGCLKLFLHDEGGRMKVPGTKTNEKWPSIFRMEVVVADPDRDGFRETRCKKPVKVSDVHYFIEGLWFISVIKNQTWSFISRVHIHFVGWQWGWQVPGDSSDERGDESHNITKSHFLDYCLDYCRGPTVITT